LFNRFVRSTSSFVRQFRLFDKFVRSTSSDSTSSRIPILWCLIDPNRFFFMFLYYFLELFHTEKSHVRNLKVLDRLFLRPLKDSMVLDFELTDQLFPNLDEVLSVHSSYNNKMKEKVKAGYPIGLVGKLLSDMVKICQILTVPFCKPHSLF